MKRLWMLAILMVVLAACGGSAAPSGGQCNKGLCVKIEVVEPIRWGEPIEVTVTVTAEKDVPNLQVSLTSYPPLSMEDHQGTWVEEGIRSDVNLIANRPLVAAYKVRLPSEGTFELRAGAYAPNLPYVSDSVRIYLSDGKGKVYRSGTPIPVTPWSLPVYTVTPGPSPTPLPTFTLIPTLPFTPTHFRSPLVTPTPPAYPFISPLPNSTPAAYP